MLVFYKSVNKIEVSSISDMARNIPPTPTRSRKGGATPKVTLMINQLETLKTEIFSMQVLSLPSNSALFSHYEASLTCNFSDSVTSTSCIPNGKNSQRLKIIRGMRSVGREGRSIDLKMFFVEHPVRVISVAVLVATF